MEPPTPTENHFRRPSQCQPSPSPSQASSQNGQQPLTLQKVFEERLQAQQSQRQPFHPSFPQKLHELSLHLAPFVQLTSGQVHPCFPSTLLHFWLLTSDQLDALAAFYHQAVPCEWTRHYPCPITWRADLSLEEKRRKIGKFIGLRGCDTPVAGSLDWGRAKTEEEIMDDARRARLAAEEEEIRRKMGWY